jgi:tRNA (guanine-N7-)-methyltransferase
MNQKYEINPKEYSNFPLPWGQIFSHNRPLAVEIGCGNGEFLIAWATEQPDWNFIGIEMSLAAAERTQFRIQHAGLHNVRLIKDEALFSLREFFQQDSIKEIKMNFPDPWPKDKHCHRRLINQRFVQTLSAVLEPRGVFELVTDQEWYAVEALSQFSESGRYQVTGIEESPQRIMTTKYERKWKEENRRIFRLKTVKLKGVKFNRIVEKENMPHIVLEKAPAPVEIYNLKGLEKSTDEIVFKFSEIFSSPDERRFLIRTITKDKGYTQHFFIAVAPHQRGSIIKIDKGFQPYRTAGVKMAIREIGKKLQG